MDSPRNDGELQRAPWNRSATAYADVFQGQVTQAIDPLLDAAGVGMGSRVLDVATGPGLIAAAATGRGAVATGVDFAENMVAVARKRHPAIDFEGADASDLPFESARFDAVVIGFALFMMTEPEKALREALRVLVPGGKMAATVWDWPAPGFELFYGPMANYEPEEPALSGDLPLFGVSDPEVLAAAVSKAGFVDAAVTRLPIVWEIASIDRLFDALATLRDFSAISAESMRSFRAEVANDGEQYKHDKGYAVPFPALLLSGSKT